MRRILLSIVAVFALCASAFADEGQLTQHTLRHKGVEYTYWLYLPPNLPADAPLVVVFHGYGSRNIPSLKYGFNALADRNGFAVCYPRGTQDFRGKHCWDVGYSFHKEKGWKRDEVGFACRLVRTLQKEYGLSRTNVFATGHSNGGEMCYLLAYTRPDVFAAVAPVSGLTMEWMYRELEAKKPIPLLEIHGTEDKTSAWNGDPTNKGGWGKYIAVPRAVGYWAAVDRCTHEQVEKLPLRRNQVVAHRYVGGTDGTEVWLYEVVGGVHKWSDGSMNTAAEIWKFFSKYLK
jgi:polyhydroxybutyrate depolymerase